jgi:hypothetical protein
MRTQALAVLAALLAAEALHLPGQQPTDYGSFELTRVSLTDLEWG